MCPKPARLATALALILAAGALSTPAFALFGKARPAPAAASAAAGEAPAAPPRKSTPAERAQAERLEPLARAAFWAHEASADPRDVDAGVHFARALRALGKTEEAVQTADLVLVGAPNDLEAILEDARAKISNQQGFYAIEVLKRGQTIAPRDWRLPSLLGVALEQSQRPQEAQAAYQQALTLSPENPAVLSNVALFYAGAGDAAQAEVLLRRAVTRPGSGVQERQNLALVLGLQGKLSEAERYLRQDLPPEVANANLEYLKSLAAGGQAQAALPGQMVQGQLQAQMQQPPRAATLAPTALATPPASARNWSAMAASSARP